MNRYSLRISDLNSSPNGFREINLAPIISGISAALSPNGSASSEPKLSLLYYSDEIVAVHYERKGKSNNDQILAIRTKEDIPDDQRLIRHIELESSTKLFARHTASFIYYGTYTGMGDHGHHEWVIHGVSLDKDQPLPEALPIQLEEFFGTDIGSTIAFEIHDGYFYALSNQTSFDVEELDWTSFYHCVRFPLNNPLSKALKVNKRIYRRQHAEGPIHDSWTDLSLQVDECTNQLMIVEARREWQNGSSKQLRTFYTQKIRFPPKAGSSDSDDDDDNDDEDGSSPANEEDSQQPLLPLNDPLVNMIDSSNRPNYAPEQPRYARYTHPEFGKEGSMPGRVRSFILARTKYRAYNFAYNSFLDIVEDDKCCANPCNPNAGSCLRLRIGSRRLEPVMPVLSADKSRSNSSRSVSNNQSSKPPATAAAAAASEDRRDYRYSPIRMWPPPASTCPCAYRLHRILNPLMDSRPGASKTIVGVLDERNLVYMVRPGRFYGEDETLGTVVVIGFTQQQQLESLATSSTTTLPKNSSLGFKAASGDHPLSQSEWVWTPGLASACRQGSCC